MDKSHGLAGRCCNKKFVEYFLARIGPTLLVFSIVPATQLYVMLAYFGVMTMVTDTAVVDGKFYPNESVEKSYEYVFAAEAWAVPPLEIDLDFALDLDLWNPVHLLVKVFGLDLPAIELSYAAIIVVLLSSAAAYATIALDYVILFCRRRCSKRLIAEAVCVWRAQERPTSNTAINKRFRMSTGVSSV